jgi:hypothetical protein
MTPRDPPPDVEARLESLPPDVRALIERARRLILATLPKAIELADRRARVIGYGYGPGYKDMVATLILSKQGVKLGLAAGVSLPDPDGLLAGSGKVHRHIAFTESRQVGQPAVKTLLQAALAAWKARAAGRA